MILLPMWRLALVVVVAVASGRAFADDTAESTRLFDEGRELVKAGRYGEACDKFNKSLEVDRAVGTVLNYGDCLEKVGDLRRAYEMFVEAARTFEATSDPRASFALDRAAALEAKLGVVAIDLADARIAGLTVHVGADVLSPSAHIVVRVEPGDIAVDVSAPGRVPVHKMVQAVAGQRVVIEVPVLQHEAAPATPRAVVPVVEQRDSGRTDHGRVKLAIGVGAVGAAALVGSGVLGLLARSQYNSAVADECSQATGELLCSGRGASRVDSATTKANIATGLAIGGGVLVTAGVILFVTAPKERLVVPTASASSVGLSYFARF